MSGSPGAADAGAEAKPRDRLLAAAAVCLSERGFEKTRVRDVANHAGVSIGLVQHYFESRDDLLREAFSWSCDELIERWRARATSWPDDPWRRIEYLIDELTLVPGLKRRAATWTEFCASAARHPELREPVSHVFATWRQIIVDAIAAAASLGQIEPELPATDVADILNALVDGFEMATAVDTGVISPERFGYLVMAVATRLLHPRSDIGDTELSSTDQLPDP